VTGGRLGHFSRAFGRDSQGQINPTLALSLDCATVCARLDIVGLTLGPWEAQPRSDRFGELIVCTVIYGVLREGTVA